MGKLNDIQLNDVKVVVPYVLTLTYGIAVYWLTPSNLFE